MANAKDEWYVARDGKAAGPYTTAQMQADARAGSLKPTEQIWREGMPAWVNAGGIMEIFAPNPPGAAPDRAPAMPPPMPPQPIGYASPRTAPRDIGQDAGVRMLLPVGRSGWAIASGYLGLFAFFPLIGLLTGPCAVITGILAIREMKRDPNKHGMGRAVFGIIAGALFGIANVVGLAMVLLNESNL